MGIKTAVAWMCWSDNLFCNSYRMSCAATRCLACFIFVVLLSALPRTVASSVSKWNFAAFAGSEFTSHVYSYVLNAVALLVDGFDCLPKFFFLIVLESTKLHHCAFIALCDVAASGNIRHRNTSFDLWRQCPHNTSAVSFARSLSNLLIRAFDFDQRKPDCRSRGDETIRHFYCVSWKLQVYKCGFIPRI